MTTRTLMRVDPLAALSIISEVLREAMTHWHARIEEDCLSI
jgi:hypothetical protein